MSHGVLLQYRSPKNEPRPPSASELLQAVFCGAIAMTLAGLALGLAASALLRSGGNGAMPSSASALLAVICGVMAAGLWGTVRRLLSPKPRSVGPRRFTVRMQMTLAAAVDEVARRGSVALDTEHLMAGLLVTGPNAALAMLDAMNVPAAALGEGGRGVSQAAGVVLLTLPVPAETTAARTALRRAVAEAEARGLEYVGTQHLLLALVRGDGAGLRSCIPVERLLEQIDRDPDPTEEANEESSAAVTARERPS